MIPVEDTDLPRFVRFRGKRVRLIGYKPKTDTVGARFVVLDTDDRRRSVPRCFITFVKDSEVGNPNFLKRKVSK